MPEQSASAGQRVHEASLSFFRLGEEKVAWCLAAEGQSVTGKAGWLGESLRLLCY